MNARLTKTTLKLVVVGLLAVLAWAGTVANGYSVDPPPPPPTHIHVNETKTSWLATGAVIRSIEVTPGTGTVSAVKAPPNGFRVTGGVHKGTAKVTVSGTLATYRYGKPPLRTYFSTTYQYIVD